MTHITIDTDENGNMPAVHIGLTNTFDIVELARQTYPDAKIKRITFVDMHMIRGRLLPTLPGKHRTAESDWNIYIRMTGLPEGFPRNASVQIWNGRVACDNDIGEPFTIVYIGRPFEFSKQRMNDDN